MVVGVAGIATTPPTAEAETTQQVFISKIVGAAQENQATSLVPASVTMGQAILESGWGKSSLAAKYNNYFGIKCTSTASPYQSGCVTLASTEYVGTPATPKVYYSSFRTYSSITNSFKDHSRLLTTASRYAKAFQYTQNPDQFIKEIAAAGYATDPAYANSVISLMNQYSLKQYNLTPSDPKVTVTTSLKNTFFSKLGATAQQAQLLFGAPASVLLAQAAYHSNYGTTILATSANNYFGMTCTATASPYQSGCYTVTRSVNGKIVTAKYRMYRNFTASMMDVANMYATNSRYAATKSYRNAPETFLRAVSNAGYTGSSTYAATILPFMRSNTLYRYDCPFTTLKYGQSGYRVNALQRLLIAAGYTKVGFTARFDTATQTAVRQFQAASKVSVTGVATPETIRLLTVKYAKTPTNHRVSALQVLLVGKGYPTKVWGYFDTTTSLRVTQFNYKNNGPSNDVASIMTWGKLFV